MLLVRLEDHHVSLELLDVEEHPHLVNAHLVEFPAHQLQVVALREDLLYLLVAHEPLAPHLAHELLFQTFALLVSMLVLFVDRPHRALLVRVQPTRAVV